MEYDYKSWCRLCGALESLDKEIEETLANTIQFLFPNLPLSMKICINCENELRNITSFISKVQNTDKMFIGLDDEDPEDLSIMRLNAYRNYFKMSTKIDTKVNAVEVIEEEIQEDNQLVMYEDEEIIEEYVIDAIGQEEIETEETPKTDYSPWNFKCHICNQKPYQNFFLLLRHCKVEHNSPPSVKCCSNECQKMLSSWRRLLIHKEQHFPSYGKLVCEICTLPLHSKASYEKHMKNHEEKVFICSFCAKKFNDKKILVTHEKIHTPLEERKIFECDKCGAKFITKQGLYYHLFQKHIKMKTAICPEENCGKSFFSRKAMSEHLRTHREKSFACNLCSFLAKTKSHLYAHLRNHKRSYQCDKCETSFETNNLLKSHLKNMNCEKK